MSEKDQLEFPIKFGPRESEFIRKVAKERGMPDERQVIRIMVTVFAALTAAENLDLKCCLYGANGKRYSYSLRDPKIAKEIDVRGVETGKVIKLLDLLTPPPKPKKPRLKVIK